MVRKLIVFVITLFVSSHPIYAQQITDVSPDQGQQGNTLSVSISGQNTNFGSASTTEIIFTQGTITGEGFDRTTFSTSFNQIVNPDSIQASLPLYHLYKTGLYDVVYFENGQEITKKEDAFEVLPDPNGPEITNVSPDRAEAGDSLTVSLSGKNTNFDQGTEATFVLTNDELDIFYTTNESGYFNGTSPTKATVKMNLPDSLQDGYYDIGISYQLPNTTYPTVFVKDDGFQIIPGGSKPAIQNNIEDTFKLNQTHQLEIQFNSGNLQTGDTTTVFLESGTNQIHADQIADMQGQMIKPVFNVPANADTGHYDLVVNHNSTNQIRKEDAIYLEDETIGILGAGSEKELLTNVFPNPVRGRFNFKVNLPESLRLNAEIMNTNGQVVQSIFERKVSAGKHTFEDIALNNELPAGNYLLRITSEDGGYADIIRFQKQ